MTGKIRVLLVDDHAVLRAGLRALLNIESDIEVVGEAGNGNEALEKIEALQPDVAVMDLTMPGLSGLDAIEYISKHYPNTRTLVLTMYAEEQYILRTVELGGSGYVLKSAADQELIKAIRQVYAGESYFYAKAMQILLDHHRQGAKGGEAGEDKLDTLSEREYKVLLLTVQGYSSREIGEKLYISPKTVDTYRQRLMTKLDLSHRADLFQYALRKGLLERGDFLLDMVEGEMEQSAIGHVYDARAHPAQNVEWDETHDVIVAGSGTGLMAALQTADAGLDVILLEKSAQLGGTMGISGGGLWVPNNFLMQESGISDSSEEALEYLHYATMGQADPELARTFVEHCNGAITFLRKMGVEWDFLPTFNDYYPHFPGGKSRGRSLVPVGHRPGETQGGALVRIMYEAAVARGVRFCFNAPVKRLVVDDDGAVIGVIASVNGQQERNIRARRGVVLATGGFDHNRAMVNNFLRGPLYYTSAVKTNTGDGHLMGMALGASLRHMNERWGWPVFYDPASGEGINALAIELGRPGAAVVNRKGVRIMNEAGPYDAVTRAFYTFDTGTYEYINIPSFVIVDSSHRSRYTLASFAPDARLPEWVIKANTLTELSDLLGIHTSTFVATIKRFNHHAARGVDPEFKRGESDFDTITAGDPQRTDLKNICLAPIAEPPYYGTPIWPGALGTSGGLQINSSAQVLNVWGNVIPGLYAVGNTSGSPIAGGYPGGGGTLSAGLTFAHIAAAHILRQSPRE